MRLSSSRASLLGLVLLAAASGPPSVLADGEQGPAKQSQNPVADVVSVPFESNVLFGLGPSDSSAYVLNVKPVYPLRIGKLNLINRLILPVIYAEGQDVTLTDDQAQLLGFGGEIRLANGSAFGLGDTTYQAFFSPAEPGNVIWGIGPALVLPTATDNRFASDKWSAGISAVALAMPGRWVVGTQVQNVWSFAGDGDAELRAVADPANRPLVFHCSHGVHRTGTAAAILLSVLGVPWETVREDYLLSNHYRADEIDRRLAELRALAAESQGVPPDAVDTTNMEAFYRLQGAYIDASLEEAVRQHGSMAAYARDGLGLTKAEIEALREQLLVPSQD